jgi:hypothetical protein
LAGFLIIRQLEIPIAAQGRNQIDEIGGGRRAFSLQPSALGGQLPNEHREHAFDLGCLQCQILIIVGLDQF